jgi:hypothetical protein
MIRVEFYRVCRFGDPAGGYQVFRPKGLAHLYGSTLETPSHDVWIGLFVTLYGFCGEF